LSGLARGLLNTPDFMPSAEGAMQIETLEVRRDDLSKSRIIRQGAPPLEDGQVLMTVERFGITANNITYGVLGDALSYWQFFPAETGWGIIPVWGVGEVAETRHPEVGKGERCYGYFPMASHLVVRPGRLKPERLFDVSAHRASLPPVYNSYARLEHEPGYDRSLDDERVALFPLYATSYVLFDFLGDNGWFGASQCVVVSASSKTAIGLAYALHDDESAPACIGLTSPANAASVKRLGLYDRVVSYDRISDVDASLPSVVVDMSGSGPVLSELHAHLGERMRHCANVGATHHSASRTGPGIQRERSAFFFAPSQIKKRADDWGPGEFERRALAFWRDAALRSRDWITIERCQGADALERAFHELRLGKVAPDRAIVASL
jgi:hypothetical protein